MKHTIDPVQVRRVKSMGAVIQYPLLYAVRSGCRRRTDSGKWSFLCEDEAPFRPKFKVRIVQNQLYQICIFGNLRVQRRIVVFI